MNSVTFKDVAYRTTLNMALPVIQTLKTGITCCDGKVWLSRCIWFPLYWKASFWHFKIIKASSLRRGVFLYYLCKSLSPEGSMWPRQFPRTAPPPWGMNALQKGGFEKDQPCTKWIQQLQFVILPFFCREKIPTNNKKTHDSDFFWLKLSIQKAVFINESY